MYCDVVFYLDSFVIRSSQQWLSIASKVHASYWGRVSLKHCGLSLAVCLFNVCMEEEEEGVGGGGGGKRGGEIYTSVDLSYNFHHDDDAHVECKGIKGSRWVCSSCVQTHTLGIHSRTVLSRDAEATRCPDGEKATDNMASYREVKAVKILRIECNRRRVEKSNEKG